MLLRVLRLPSLFWAIVISLYLTVKLSSRLLLGYSSVVEKVLISLLILSITSFFSNLLSELLQVYISKASLKFPRTGIVFVIIKLFVFILGTITILSYLGIQVVHFITTLGIAGLAISLALQGTLSNILAGLNLIASRQIEVGDFVRLENGEEGYVEDITWMNTIIRRRDNNLVVVPNSRLVNSIVINYGKPVPSMNTVVSIVIPYSSDLEKAERLTLEVAKEVQKTVEGADPNFEPSVRYNAFTELGITLNITLRVLNPDYQFLIRHEFIKRLKKAYEREGVPFIQPSAQPSRSA
ncbi:MAG: mechanosensitive ion channel family protein [Thermocrinis sp.]|nr:mechanosensitive ion channel family protein [Thermocrinis sp.]